MFKQLYDYWKARRLRTVMRAANGYLQHNELENAKEWLGIAEYFSINSKLHRRLLVDVVLGWAVLSASWKDKGNKAYADRCTVMMHLLQSRLDAGDYYSDPPKAWGLFDD